MIAEKSHTAQLLISKLSGKGSKVPFVDNDILGKALSYLENKGIPTAKHEDYKYCNMDAVLRREFKALDGKLQDATEIAAYKLENTVTIVVMNGRYSSGLSDKVLLKGLKVGSFADLDVEGKKLLGSAADVESDAFIALNTAFSSEGFYLSVEKGVSIPMPLHVLYINSSEGESVVNPRNLVLLSENSELTLIEEQLNIGNGKVFCNFLSERFLAPNSKLHSYTIQNEGRAGYSVNTNQVKAERDAVYENTTITLSGQVVRNNHNVALNGENANAYLYGLFGSGGTQLVDNHTMVDHRVPNCQSNELYKGIVDDRSTGVFNGKIFVRRDAQKTNAYQSSKNILLSDDASVNAKPQLEIYADDVKCSHGTSTGRLDENALFYLNSRGIGAEASRKMLLASFAGEIVSKIEPDALRNKISTFFENGFSG